MINALKRLAGYLRQFLPVQVKPTESEVKLNYYNRQRIRLKKSQWLALFSSPEYEVVEFLERFYVENQWVHVPDYDAGKSVIARLCSTQLMQFKHDDLRLFVARRMNLCSECTRCDSGWASNQDCDHAFVVVSINPALYRDFQKNFTKYKNKYLTRNVMNIH